MSVSLSLMPSVLEGDGFIMALPTDTWKRSIRSNGGFWQGRIILAPLQFRPKHPNFGRCFNSQTDAVALETNHRNHDRIADLYSFALSP